MGYVYSALWFLTAFLLLCRFRKESVVVYILSAYFVFAGVWWLADEMSVTDMMSGTYAWILRMVSVAALLIAAVVYLIEKNIKGKKKAAVQASDEQELHSADHI